MSDGKMKVRRFYYKKAGETKSMQRKGMTTPKLYFGLSIYVEEMTDSDWEKYKKAGFVEVKQAGAKGTIKTAAEIAKEIEANDEKNVEIPEIKKEVEEANNDNATPDSKEIKNVNEGENNKDNATDNVDVGKDDNGSAPDDTEGEKEEKDNGSAADAEKENKNDIKPIKSEENVGKGDVDNTVSGDIAPKTTNDVVSDELEKKEDRPTKSTRPRRRRVTKNK